MRVLFLSSYFPPYHVGGYEELCAEVATGFSKRGHVVRVLTSNRQAGRGTAADESLKIVRALHNDVSSDGLGPTGNFFLKRKTRLLENLHCLQNLFETFQPDICMVWGMWNLSRRLPAWAEEYARLPVVYYVADYWPALPDNSVLHWNESARRSLTRIPKRLIGKLAFAQLAREPRPPELKFENAICVSKAVRESLRTSGLPFEHASVIYNGIDLQPFSELAVSPSLNRDIQPSLVYAGRLSPEKGLDIAIEALALLHKKGYRIRMTVLGKGESEYVSKLISLARHLNVSDFVIFHAAVPRERLPALLNQHEIMIVPSTWPDPLPRIIQEGMAAGVAVVASAIGGIPEIVNDGINGYTFTTGNSSALAQKIERLLVDEPLRQQFLQTARATVTQHFTLTRMLDELEEYLTGVLTKS